MDMQARPPQGPRLVADAQRGDRAAFAALVACERRALVMTARGVVGDLHEAEDCAQEALVAAWRHLGDLREPGAFRGWLFRILVRIAGRRRADLRRRLSLFYFAGLSYRETAEILDVHEGLVKSRLHEARRQLKRRLTHARS
jgi:RNA polymerase sigma-70 factor (ECF subfamily)